MVIPGDDPNCQHPKMETSTSGLCKSCPDCGYYWEYD